MLRYKHGITTILWKSELLAFYEIMHNDKVDSPFFSIIFCLPLLLFICFNLIINQDTEDNDNQHIKGMDISTY